MTVQGKILAVDDTPASLRLLTDILKAEGYEVRSAISGELALRSATNDPPDLVLLDILMPEPDGFEVCRRLKAQAETRDVPVIFVSGMTETIEKVQGFQLGAVDFITKPFQREELLARVRTHLELNRLRNYLEDLVEERTAELRESEGRVRQLNESLEELVRERTEALRESEEHRQRYRNLFENMTDGYALHEIILDGQGKPRDYRFLEVNPAFERMLRLKREDVVGKTVLEVLPETEPQWIENYGRVALTGEGTRFEQYSRNFDRHFEATASSPERGLFAVFFSDVTERKMAEQEVRQANDKLTETLKELRATQQQIIQSEKLAALGTLAAGVSHELNNPLMGVMGYVGMARRRAQEPEVAEMLENADRELVRMRDLLKNLLGFARPVEGKLSPVSIPIVLERVLALMQPDFKFRAITVTTDVPQDLPLVRAIADHLQQVFLNLLLNARDAVEGRPEKRIRVAAYRAGPQIVVTMTDTGPGIPLAIQGRIFDPFFTTKPPGKGTGLGLSIARNIITDLGGSLTCESHEGEGATFTVALPLPSVQTGEKAHG